MGPVNLLISYYTETTNFCLNVEAVPNPAALLTGWKGEREIFFLEIFAARAGRTALCVPHAISTILLRTTSSLQLEIFWCDTITCLVIPGGLLDDHFAVGFAKPMCC